MSLGYAAGSKKICVSVNSESELLKLHQQALDAGLITALIQDAGLPSSAAFPPIRHSRSVRMKMRRSMSLPRIFRCFESGVKWSPATQAAGRAYRFENARNRRLPQ